MKFILDYNPAYRIALGVLFILLVLTGLLLSLSIPVGLIVLWFVVVTPIVYTTARLEHLYEIGSYFYRRRQRKYLDLYGMVNRLNTQELDRVSKFYIDSIREDVSRPSVFWDAEYNPNQLKYIISNIAFIRSGTRDVVVQQAGAFIAFAFVLASHFIYPANLLALILVIAIQVLVAAATISKISKTFDWLDDRLHDYRQEWQRLVKAYKDDIVELYAK